MALFAMSVIFIACNKGEHNLKVQDDQLLSPMSADTAVMEKIQLKKKMVILI